MSLTPEEIERLRIEHAAPKRVVRTASHPLLQQMRILRERAGVSARTLGERINVSPVTVGSYERGDRMPPLDVACAVFAEIGYELRAVPIGTPEGGLWVVVDQLEAVVAQLRAAAGEGVTG